jgi:cytidyltransferase-like protein
MDKENEEAVIRRSRIPKKRILVSGGFDPIHVGHIRLIQAAAKLGSVIVAVNSDAWLRRKKGYIFMPFEQRCEVIQALKGVSAVTYVEDDDGTVCEALERLKPDMFGNGGDRTDKNTPEMDVCEDLGIEMVWELGGGKVQSSSELVEKIIDF